MSWRRHLPKVEVQKTSETDTESAHPRHDDRLLLGSRFFVHDARLRRFDAESDGRRQVRDEDEEEDEDMQEAGEDYAAIIQLPFKLVETSSDV